MAKQELIEVGYYLGKTPRERIDYLIDDSPQLAMEAKSEEEAAFFSCCY